MDKKNQQSKSQYGTMTAKYDVNGDYGSASTSATSSTTGGMTTGGTNQILTSQYDANGDYNKNNQQSGGNQSGQGGKVKTSNHNIGGR